MRRFKFDQKYLHWGVTAFLVIAASILFYFLVRNLGWLRTALVQLGGILSPFIWGLVIAYLLYPLMKLYSRALFTPLAKLVYRKSPKAEKRIPALSRGLSVLLCIVTLLVMIGGLIRLVAPQLYNSVESIVLNSSDYISRADAWVTRTFADYPELETTVSSAVGDLSKGVVSWATEKLLPQMSSLLAGITSNVVQVFRGIYNIIIGIIVSVYMLYSRETFAAHCKRIIYCIFSPEASRRLLQGMQFVNDVFMGFLSGKILDSLIVGIICYIGCLILKMPYPLLLAFIIGLFNIIPFFGPFIGTVPTAIIVLTESPWKALIFIVFIIILQQFDGNILGPKILGNRVGINGFWIMFAIILGAGLFGFAGMLLGVPVFVLIYTFFSGLISKKLRRSGLPSGVEEYKAPGYFDPQTLRPTPWPEEPQEASAKGRRRFNPLQKRQLRHAREQGSSAEKPESEASRQEDLSGDGPKT